MLSVTSTNIVSVKGMLSDLWSQLKQFHYTLLFEHEDEEEAFLDFKLSQENKWTVRILSVSFLLSLIIIITCMSDQYSFDYCRYASLSSGSLQYSKRTTGHSRLF